MLFDSSLIRDVAVEEEAKLATDDLINRFGCFARWQPEYAEPAESRRFRSLAGQEAGRYGLRQARPKASRDWSTGRFARAEAFGFMLRAGLGHILDIDSAGRALIADAPDRHGRSPFVVRTGSGHFHVYYAHQQSREPSGLSATSR